MNVYQQLRLSIAFLILLALVPVGAALAQVEVTSADPASAPQGTISLDVTVAGNGFDSTANVKFLVTGTTDPGGITVKSVKVRGSRKLIATIDIAETAIVDKFDIVVELSDGRKGKGTSLFAVQRKSGPNSNINPAFVVDPVTTYKQRVATMAADGTGELVLSGPLNYDPDPQWSPDGQSIVYFDRLPMLLVRMDSRSGAVQATTPAESSLPVPMDWSNGNVGSCGDLIVFDGRRDARSDGSGEIDLFVTNGAMSQKKQLVMQHDLDDGWIGNDTDPDVEGPAWSQDGRFIIADEYIYPYTNPLATTNMLYAVSCTGDIDVVVESETPLTLSFGDPVESWGGYAWNSSGQYIAMVAFTGMDADLWVADLGDPGQPGYPSTTPVLYRLTGVDRPFGEGPVRVQGVVFAPAADVIAFVTNTSGSAKTDNLYTINAGDCIAALNGVGSVTTGCVVTLISKGINARSVDWRPNWPSLLP